MKRPLLLLLVLLSMPPLRAQKSDAPFMGILTWNVFEDQISEEKVKLLADAIVDLQLDKAGYRYICIDDCWALPERDSKGHLQPNPQKFPSGFHSLTSYLHSKGLKAGIYSDAGHHTCSGSQPGSLGHEKVDARDFAQWGFDLLKYDFCNSPSNTKDCAIASYLAMHKALRRQCPSDFIFYVCEWGHLEPWTWASSVGSSCWRATDDTRDCWVNPTYKGGVLDNIKIFANIWPHTSPGHYSDADMLMCGLHGSGRSSNAGTDSKGMTQEEYKTQFILWSMWSSPLTLCFDITTLYDGHSRISDLYNPYYEEDLALITHPGVIAIDQDPLGNCAQPLVFNNDCLILFKALDHNQFAVSITNLSNHRQEICLELSQIPHGLPEGSAITLLDVWNNIPLPGYHTNDLLAIKLPPHGTELLLIQPPANK